MRDWREVVERMGETAEGHETKKCGRQIETVMSLDLVVKSLMNELINIKQENLRVQHCSSLLRNIRTSPPRPSHRQHPTRLQDNLLLLTTFLNRSKAFHRLRQAAQADPSPNVQRLEPRKWAPFRFEGVLQFKKQVGMIEVKCRDR